ncbi:cytochrome P450 [Lactarius pseudohatsudake]|nr:cytochrome P450 [Lactarius pseudohatsudake]
MSSSPRYRGVIAVVEAAMAISNLFQKLLTHWHLSDELIYLSVFGRGILVVNSQRVAVDLLEKRSNIYSDRPRYISFNEFLTENLTFAFTGYGDLWRRFRRPAVEGFSKPGSSKIRRGTNVFSAKYQCQAKGIDQPSFGAMLIKNQGKYHLSERERAWPVGDMLSAGGNTTSTTLHWWVLALLAHPEVQVQAHAELDDVVGSTRPPTFADLPFLPYIRAMVKEALRWSPTAPFGVPRASSADWYEGMFIPKGTIILPNMRVINFETAVFGTDSARFNPASYSKVVMDGREEGHLSFGYGRRVCPGRHVAEGTLGIDFATLLWALRFEHLEGAQGELDVHTVVHSGIGAHPVPFECKAVPRFAEAEVLLKEALNLYEMSATVLVTNAVFRRFIISFFYQENEEDARKRQSTMVEEGKVGDMATEDRKRRKEGLGPRLVGTLKTKKKGNKETRKSENSTPKIQREACGGVNPSANPSYAQGWKQIVVKDAHPVLCSFSLAISNKRWESR